MNDENWSNKALRDGLRALRKSLPKEGTAGRDGELGAREARTRKKGVDPDYEAECDVFLNAMNTVHAFRNADRDSGDGGASFADLVGASGSSGGRSATSGKSVKSGKAGRAAAGQGAASPKAGAASAAGAEKATARSNAAPEEKAEPAFGSLAANANFAKAAEKVARRSGDEGKDAGGKGAKAVEGEEGGPDPDGDSTMEALLSPERPEEDMAFFEAMRGVTPLSGSGREVTPPVVSRGVPVSASDPLRDLVEGKVEFSLAYTDEYMEGHVMGLDLLTVGKLRQGGFSPEANVDLHGLNVQQAFETLRGFFRSCWFKGVRCVLVVSGRGKGSPNGVSVLREKLRFWFTQEPFKRVILAFCTAQVRDGGPGSVYVLLRKYKKKGFVAWDRMPADEDLY